MSKLLPTLVCAVVMAAFSPPAEAGGWQRHHGADQRHSHFHKSFRPYHFGHAFKHRHTSRHGHAFKRPHFKRHHRHHHRHGNGIVLGAGIFGGTIILDSLLSSPRAAPPRVHYVEPRQPYCVQDQVYRRLPDGRLQWGTRTRCY